MRTFSATKLANSLMTALAEVPAAKQGAVIKAFVRMIGKKHWLKYADRIIAAVTAEQDRRNEVTAITLTTARPIVHADSLKRQLKAAFKTDVRIETAVDERLIGGASIQYGDTRLDASVRRSLDELKTRFAN